MDTNSKRCVDSTAEKGKNYNCSGRTETNFENGVEQENAE